MLKSVAVASAVLALALVVSPFAAEADDWGYRYIGEIMSPFCPGRTLSACPSPQAESLREWILEQEQAGRGQEDVHQELYERFGDVILAAPRAQGFGVTAYLIPTVIFLATGLLVFVFLWRQTRAAAEHAAEAPPAEPLDPEIERAIDEELAR
jgi:cytochrome c-type biogenesis protein CcmH/NrfF